MNRAFCLVLKSFLYLIFCFHVLGYAFAASMDYTDEHFANSITLFPDPTETVSAYTVDYTEKTVNNISFNNGTNESISGGYVTLNLKGLNTTYRDINIDVDTDVTNYYRFQFDINTTEGTFGKISVTGVSDGSNITNIGGNGNNIQELSVHEWATVNVGGVSNTFGQITIAQNGTFTDEDGVGDYNNAIVTNSGTFTLGEYPDLAKLQGLQLINSGVADLQVNAGNFTINNSGTLTLDVKGSIIGLMLGNNGGGKADLTFLNHGRVEEIDNIDDSTINLDVQTDVIASIGKLSMEAPASDQSLLKLRNFKGRLHINELSLQGNSSFVFDDDVATEKETSITIENLHIIGGNNIFNFSANTNHGTNINVQNIEGSGSSEWTVSRNNYVSIYGVNEEGASPGMDKLSVTNGGSMAFCPKYHSGGSNEANLFMRDVPFYIGQYDGSSEGELLIEDTKLLINTYNSTGTLLSFLPGQGASNGAKLSINKVEHSSSDKIFYVFETSSINLGEEISIQFLDIIDGKIIDDYSQIDFNVLLGGIISPDAQEVSSISIVDTDKGQAIYFVYNKENLLPGYIDDPLLIGLSEQDRLLFSQLYSLIDSFEDLTLLPDNLNDLVDLTTYYLTIEELDKLFRNLRPIAYEIYLMDSYLTSSTMLNHMFKEVDYSKSMSGNIMISVTPIMSFDFVDSKDFVSGYDSDKVMGQASLVIKYNDNFGFMSSLALGFGSLEGDKSVSHYEIDSQFMLVALGGYVTNELVTLKVAGGVSMNKYDSNRGQQFLEDIEHIIFNNTSTKAEADHKLRGIIGAVELSADLETDFASFTPSLYYKMNMVSFEDYTEEGSPLSLYVMGVEDVLVSDFGINLAVRMNSVFKPTLALGVGYMHYSMDDFEYTFVDAKDLPYNNDFFVNNSYKGLYISPAVTVNAIDGAFALVVGYSSNIYIDSAMSHDISIRAAYNF